MEDLSHFHHVISDLFPNPESKKEWEAYKLSDRQVAHFDEFGYVSGIQLLNEEEISVMRSSLQRLTEDSHPGHHLFYEYHSNESKDPKKCVFHALGQWRIEESFHDVIWHPRFRMAAKQLLGGAVRFWHDQIFSKPALHGGVVAWHQDYSYWTRTIEMNHLTCWIGLDDTNNENGCLQYIPGSHKWGLLEKPELTGDMVGVMSSLNEEQEKAFKNPFPVALKAGQCSFHHPLLVHGSFANLSDRPRRAFVLNVFKDGVVSDSNEPLLQGVNVIPQGEKIDGQFFPLIME